MSEENRKALETVRRRDTQQWMLDWLVKTTGREQNFAYDERKFPPDVKSYAMIARIMERQARHKEMLARGADARGHRETARQLYYRAIADYHAAQHSIFEDDNREKIYLYARIQACEDRMIALSPTAVERVEIPWENRSIPGLLYVQPKAAQPAPSLLWANGMDSIRELWPDPLHNWAFERGFNVLVIDGPGQGLSNLRKIRVTEDNWERAGRAAIDYLVSRPEIDPERIGILGFSMGCYWGMRTAAIDPRVRAIATSSALHGSKRAIFEIASPKFKQMFMYMAGMRDEVEFDRMAERMTLDEHAPKIRGYTLMVVGEYDPLCPVQDAWEIYQRLGGPREFWLLENDFHQPFNHKGLAGLPTFPFLADWMADALEGRLPPDLRREVLVGDRGGQGPYGPQAAGLWLPERTGMDLPPPGLDPLFEPSP
jgi:pimeloyl-ACP methyl ester carboxylesterase